MFIKRIRVKNFKSFKDLDLELGKFNVIIGANASGKSNFLAIFKFLKDIVIYDLENAVSLQGGCEYLRNLNIGKSDNLYLEIEGIHGYQAPIPGKENFSFRVADLLYSFCLGFINSGLGFNVIDENMEVKLEFIGKKTNTVVEEGKYTISKQNSKVKIEMSIPEAFNVSPKVPPVFFPEENISDDTLFILDPSYSTLISPIRDFSWGTYFYDFDPKLPKNTHPITGMATLNENGANIALVLKSIINNEDSRRKFCNFMQDLLPYVIDFNIEKVADRSLMFKIRESYNSSTFIPASFISDGTIDIMALIIALYFERSYISFIEEPERNIHPSLISGLIEMMKDASENKQVIITTHNPEIVKHAGLENLILIKRDSNGFSVMSKPSETAELETFLENDIGVDELYTQNILESLE
ncbi:MAG: AAA family ATPase [candidate division Zixibacteria bacterium]|nr:AAA family ATPase [Candidatus Tariuqbacter arcticus]